MGVNSKARENVLKAAERLFVERGYEAVTIKDIAKAAGIHHASLYHHAPGGKSALYVEVMTRYMENYRAGIETALQNSPDDLQKQLQNIATWIVSHPPIDIIRLTTSDLPAIEEEKADRISNLAFEATLMPILGVLENARRRGQITHENLGNIAGAIFTAIEGIHAIPDRYVNRSRQFMADELIEVFIRGIQA